MSPAMKHARLFGWIANTAFVSGALLAACVALFGASRFAPRATADAPRAADERGVRGPVPSLEDVAPGVSKAGEVHPVVYILSAANLAGLAALVALSLRLFGGAERMSGEAQATILKLSNEHHDASERVATENRKALEIIADRHREAMETVGRECHTHSLAMVETANQATLQAARSGNACAAALDRCAAIIERGSPSE